MPPRRSTPIVLTTRFEEEEAGTFRHLPFELPDRIRQIRISVSYNDRIESDPRLNGGNTLDVGVFDKGGIEAGGDGFRGWSGSELDEIVIGESASTPPYRAGKLRKGTWHILLGAYKVGPNGLDATIEITTNPKIDLPEEQPAPPLEDLTRAEVPDAAERGWWRGDLHLHTTYSDGSATPAEIAAAAYEAGLDFYGITDHNRALSPEAVAPQGDGWPLLVPGIEVTTYAGHFNVWGTDDWYEFRDPTPERLAETIETASAAGGLVAVNHPKPFGPDWIYPEVSGFDAIEVWNSWWSRLNDVALAKWDEALRDGKRISAIGGSDTHHLDAPADPGNPLAPAQIGKPTLWVKVQGELTVEGVLDAIRRGDSFMSESPDGPQLYLVHDGDHVTVRIVHGAGTVMTLVTANGISSAEAITTDDESWTYALSVLGKDLKFVRAQLHSQDGGFKALTNPAWLGEK